MRVLIVLLCACFLLFCPAAVEARTVLEDDFTSTNLVDMDNTTAYVDTSEEGHVRLPRTPMPNSIAMTEYGMGYAVATSNGINLYEYDDSTGAVKQNSLFSVPWITDAVGVALRQDNLNMWAIKEDSIQYCKFSGGSMSNDPALKVSGYNDLVSVAAWEDKDEAIALSRTNDDKTELIKLNAGNGSLETTAKINMDYKDPVSISKVPGRPDLRLTTKDAVYYLAYDDASGNYKEDPAKKISLNSEAVAGSGNEQGASLVLPDQGTYYADNDAGSPESVSAFSAGNVNGAFAVSLKPGSYDQAFVTETGEVRYYTYDDATDSMARLTDMELTGLNLMKKYSSPGEYRSAINSTSSTYDTVKLSVQDDKPSGTEISYYVSSDGGGTWHEVIPGDWGQIPPGQQFVIKAVLDTTKNSETPKIIDVKLEVTTLELLDLEIVAIAMNENDQPVPITSFPAEVKAGAEVMFEVKTKGCAEQVSSLFSTGKNVNLTPEQPVLEDENTWEGFFTVPLDTPEGSTIGAEITAKRGSKEKQMEVDPLILVKGKVSQVVDLQLTQ